MSDMTTIETCKQCQTTYRLSLAFPHVCPQQPAPEGDGEWFYNYTDIHSGARDRYHIRYEGNGDCIAHASTERAAKTIVTDHRLAALVPMLQAAVETEAARRAYAAGLGVSEWEAFLWPEAIAALTAVAKERAG